MAAVEHIESQPAGATSESDRETRIAESVRLEARGTALVIVDMQNEGCERHGEGVRRIIRPIQELLGRFRSAGSNVIFVQSVRSPDQPEFTVFGHGVTLIEGSAGAEFIPELTPLPREPVVKKRTHDCFYKTEMDDLLGKLNILPARDAVVVTGIGSNNCVYHAVIGFHIRDYFVYVPEDCVHASRAEGQAFALSQFRSSAYRYNVRTVKRQSEIQLRRS